MKRPWADHPRIELVWDEGAPSLASRHQKVVVVDDRDAVPGGMHERVDCTPGDRDHDRAPDPWPDDVEPALGQRELAITVTEPETDRLPAGGIQPPRPIGPTAIAAALPPASLPSTLG